MKTNLTFLRTLGLAVFCSLVGVACADDDSSESSATNTSTTQPESVTVTPNADAELSDTDERARLTLLAGAVTEEVVVTLSVLPPNQTASAVFRFEPASLSFGPGATIALDTTGITPPANHVLQLAQFSNGEWISLPEQSLVAKSATCPIARLGDFALIAVEVATSPQCESSCLEQSGAMCCTACGCDAEVRCEPVCPENSGWDCEIGCCLTSDLTCL